MNDQSPVFENSQIRRIYNEKSETWLFSVIDIIQVLLQQNDYQTARKYWNKLKERLKKEESQSVTICHRLKLAASDGKKYLTDVASPETLLRLIQSIPSPKAEPIKLWLAKVGYERMQEISETLQATGLEENKKASKTGGKIAKNARQALEEKTGKSIISEQNYLPPETHPL